MSTTPKSEAEDSPSDLAVLKELVASQQTLMQSVMEETRDALRELTTFVAAQPGQIERLLAIRSGGPSEETVPVPAQKSTSDETDRPFYEQRSTQQVPPMQLPAAPAPLTTLQEQVANPVSQPRAATPSYGMSLPMPTLLAPAHFASANVVPASSVGIGGHTFGVHGVNGGNVGNGGVANGHAHVATSAPVVHAAAANGPVAASVPAAPSSLPLPVAPQPPLSSDHKIVQTLQNVPGSFNSTESETGGSKTPALHWLVQVEQNMMLHLGYHYATLDNVPIERLRRIMLAVVDQSAQLYLSSLDGVHAWSDLRKAWLRKYGLNVRQVKRLLDSTFQREGEKVVGYFDRIDRIQAQAEIDDQWLYETVRYRLLPHFQEKLAYLATQEEMNGKPPMTSFKAMRQWLETYEKEAQFTLRRFPNGPGGGTRDGGAGGGNRDSGNRDGGNREHSREGNRGGGRDRNDGNGGNRNEGGGGNRGDGNGGNRSDGGGGGRNDTSDRGDRRSGSPHPRASNPWTHRWEQGDKRGGGPSASAIHEEPDHAFSADVATGETVNHLWEKEERSTSTLLPNQAVCEKMATTFTDAGFNVSKLRTGGCREVAQAIVEVVAEGAEACGLLNGVQACEAYATMMSEVLNATQSVSPDIEADDFLVDSKPMADGTNREVKRKLRGTVKEVVRSLRTTIPVTKLMSVDSKIREYLLYCALSVVHAMGHQLPLPAGTKVKEVTPDQWVQWGRHLAGQTPSRYILPPDNVMEVLADVMGGQQSEPSASTQRQVRSRPQPDEQMRPVDVRFTGHLSHLFHTAARACGATVVDVRAYCPRLQPLPALVNKAHWTHPKPGSPYLEVALDDRVVRAMRDTGSNFTNVTRKLADDLGLPILPYKGSFTVADGETKYYVGKLGRTRVQLHDKLVVDMEGIRVLEGDSGQMIIGTDLIGFNEDEGSKEPVRKLREVNTVRDGKRQFLTVEVGERHSGVQFALELKTAHAVQSAPGGEGVAATMDVLPKRPVDEYWESPEQRTLAQIWLQEYHRLELGDVTAALHAALEAKVPLVTRTCPLCSKVHVDRDEFATKPHHVHRCGLCRHEWRDAEDTVSNPLAEFSPVLKDGRIVLTSTFRIDHDVRAIHGGAGGNVGRNRRSHH